jgi:hypothetical protein
MELIFTLKSLYTGSTYVAGPFDIFATTSGGSTTLIGDNISKLSLMAGVSITNVDNTVTGGTVQSVDGTCSNSVSWSLTPPETFVLDYQATLNGQILPNNTGSFSISVNGTPTVVSYDASSIGSINVPENSLIEVYINAPVGSGDPSPPFSSRILVTNTSLVDDTGQTTNPSAYLQFTITSDVSVVASASMGTAIN